MKIRTFGLGVFAASLLFVSGCGGSGLMSPSESNDRQRNSALSAEDSGLNVQVYKIDQDQISTQIQTEDESGRNNILRDASFMPECEGAVTSVENLDGLGAVFNSCRADRVAVHYWGFITIPETSGGSPVEFSASSDDGFSLSVDGEQLIDNWLLQACWETKGKGRGTANLEAGKTYPIDAWYFNYLGDYCMQVRWNIGGVEEIIPASAFSKVAPSEGAVDPEVTSTTEAPTETSVPENSISDDIVSILIDPEKSEPLRIPEASTEYICDEACISALRVALDAPTGDVIVMSGGVKTVLSGSGKQSIKLGASASSLQFSTESSAKTVSIPVVASSEEDSSTSSTSTPASTETFDDAKVGSNINVKLLGVIAAVVILILIAGAISLKRRKVAA